jgi:transketolase C-terminal domain/subunit
LAVQHRAEQQITPTHHRLVSRNGFGVLRKKQEDSRQDDYAIGKSAKSADGDQVAIRASGFMLHRFSPGEG